MPRPRSPGSRGCRTGRPGRPRRPARGRSRRRSRSRRGAGGRRARCRPRARWRPSRRRRRRSPGRRRGSARRARRGWRRCRRRPGRRVGARARRRGRGRASPAGCRRGSGPTSGRAAPARTSRRRAGRLAPIPARPSAVAHHPGGPVQRVRAVLVDVDGCALLGEHDAGAVGDRHPDVPVADVDPGDGAARGGEGDQERRPAAAALVRAARGRWSRRPGPRDQVADQAGDGGPGQTGAAGQVGAARRPLGRQQGGDRAAVGLAQPLERARR